MSENTKELESLEYTPANKNAMIFEQVEGSINVALNLLKQIEVDTVDQRGDKQGCIWTLEGWQEHNLIYLKNSFKANNGKT